VLHQSLLGVVDRRVRLVLRLDLGLAVTVRGGKLLRLAHHPVNVLVGETTRRLDADLLLLARGLVLGGHVDDAVRVDVEGHLDLGHAMREALSMQ
jgi:hypothetical protein